MYDLTSCKKRAYVEEVDDELEDGAKRVRLDDQEDVGGDIEMEFGDYTTFEQD
jgi:hypothetical protein